MCTLCRVKQPKMNNRIYFSNKKRKNLQPIKRETHRDRWRTMKWGQLQERSLLIHLLRVDPWLCFSSSAGLNDPLRLFSALYPMIWAIFFWWQRKLWPKKPKTQRKESFGNDSLQTSDLILDPAGKGTSKRLDKNREGWRNSKRMSGDLGNSNKVFVEMKSGTSS